MSGRIKGHVVILPTPGWGHVRPAVHLALSLLEQSQNLVVTFLPDGLSAKKVKQELSAYRDTLKPLAERLQVIPLIKPKESESEGYADPSADQDTIKAEAADFLPDVLAKLFTEKEGIFGIPPRTFIIDPGVAHFKTVKEGAEKAQVADVRSLALFPLSTAVLKQFYDEWSEMKNARDEQHRQDIEKHNEDLNHVRTGVDFPSFTVGQVHPQVGAGVWTPQLLNKLRAQIGLIFDDCYGVVTAGTPEIEPNTTVTFTEDIGLQLYAVGSAPRQSNAAEEIPEVVNNGRFPTDNGGVKNFLDTCLEKYGERSVAYVSFGTICWPTGSSQMVNWLLSTLLEVRPEICILLGLAPASAELSDDLKRKLEDSGRVFMCSWIPQRAVLAHPAASFYVSHCGAGSTAEAAMAGIPIVAVPQFGDQPPVAAKLCEMGCALPLYEFSNGFKGHKLHNGYVIQGTEQVVKDEMRNAWEQIQGDNGDYLRRKMKELGKTLTKSYESGGARKGIESLCELIKRS